MAILIEVTSAIGSQAMDMMVIDLVPLSSEFGSRNGGKRPGWAARGNFFFPTIGGQWCTKRVSTAPMANRFPKLIAFDLECVPKSCA